MMESQASPHIRVMALHALGYCERLFYREEVEEIRVADAAVFAGRALHEELRKVEEDVGEWTSRELCSDLLGLTGKVDCTRRRDGRVIPYEHKRGRARYVNGTAMAWDTDRIQICAYAMLLEEVQEERVDEGRIRYHAGNVTVRVPIDENARHEVVRAVERARELRTWDRRPAVTQNDRLCLHCSLAPVCLPEEERFAANPDWEPLRLFPAENDRQTLHVVTPGARIGRAGDTLKVDAPGNDSLTFPVCEVGAVVIHGFVQISTQALHFCVANAIPVHWLTAGQRYVTSTAPTGGAVHRRLRQYQALNDIGLCVRLARRIVAAKMETQLRYLLRATQGTDRRASGVLEQITTMRRALRSAAHAEGLDSLRGCEGLAGRAYFAAVPLLLKPDVPESMRPAGRSRRPPRDRFNALLSFGYAMLYQAVHEAVLAVGLEGALGVFHAPRSSAHPLVLDLMELFRTAACDMPLIGSVNRRQWDPKADFDVTPGRVWLSQTGRRKAIALFAQRLQDKWKHPVIGYSLTYQRLLELEVRLMEKEWSGSPGLFARMRLR